MKFYVLRPDTNQRPLVWWRPNCRGYTEDLDEAGRYSRAKALQLHMPSAGVYAVPCAEVDKRAKRMVADWYRDDMVALGKRAFPEPTDVDTSSPWRPIEECGELEEGEIYLVGWRGHDPHEARVWTWTDGIWEDEEGYEQQPPDYIHSVGPIRGPGEG